jgi:hypothetical protein
MRRKKWQLKVQTLLKQLRLSEQVFQWGSAPSALAWAKEWPQQRHVKQ